MSSGSRVVPRCSGLNTILLEAVHCYVVLTVSSGNHTLERVLIYPAFTGGEPRSGIVAVKWNFKTCDSRYYVVDVLV